MRVGDRDLAIIGVLYEAGQGVTAYYIGKELGCSPTQVQNRLEKLVANGSVSIENGDKSRTYHIHPALDDDNVLKRLEADLVHICQDIIGAKELTTDGLGLLLTYIVDRVNITCD